MTEYRVDFTLSSREEEGDWAEIGYGSSGTWDTVDEVAHMTNAALQTGDWEPAEEAAKSAAGEGA